jgi:hypothetical protein
MQQRAVGHLSDVRERAGDPLNPRAGNTAGMARRDASQLYGDEHIRLYRETGGEHGHDWRRGSSTLLLTTTGRRSGERRTSPLIYGRSDASPEEKPAMWREMVSQWPDYDSYQERTEREIPVVVLERS